MNFAVVFNRRNLEKGLVFQSINVFKCVGPLFETESTHSLDIIKVKERIVLHESMGCHTALSVPTGAGLSTRKD